jgi:WD40 repeat protein
VIRYFGDYELLQEIARGGMGIVFKARQVTLNRVVAVKMILAGHLANAEEVQRFHAEAAAAAKLDHPGIVPIFEIGQHEGHHYFSMGFVEGTSLARKVAAGPLSPREAAELVEKVAEAVDYAHRKGIIHRDLKPANVLLDSSGQPRVTDFGLAKQLQHDSGLTGTGQVLGTPSYMPPEQAAGKLERVGPQADVYALGAILYCLVTGRPPFQAATPMDTLLQVLEQEPVSVRKLNPQVPLDVETIALKCLEKEPARRYVSPQAIAADLRRFVNGEPILARPIGNLSRAWRWCKRKPVVAGMAAALVIATMIGVAGITWQWRRAESESATAEGQRDAAREQARIAKNERIAADKQRALAVSRERTARRLVYSSRMTLALRSWHDSRIAEVLDYLTSLVPEEGQSDLRGPEWFLLWRLCHADVQTTDGLPRGLSMLEGTSLSSDGRHLAVTRGERSVTVIDPLTGRTAAIVQAARGIAAKPGDATPDEMIRGALPLPQDRLAVSTAKVAAQPDAVVTVFDTITRQPIWNFLGHADKVTGLAVGGGGKYLVTGSKGEVATFKVWDLSSGNAVQTVSETEPGGVGGHTCCDLNAAGDRLAGSIHGNRVCVWSIPGGDVLYTTDAFAAGISRLLFCPNGTCLAVAARDGTASLLDADTGEIKRVLRAQGKDTEGMYSVHHGLALAFSPDSRRLAIGTRDSNVQLWDASGGQLLQTFKGHANWVVAVAFPSDNKIVSVSTDGTAKQWPADGGGEALVLRRHTMQVSTLAFSGNGRWLASGSLAGQQDRANVKLWDAASGQFLREFVGHNGAIQSLAFSPDGRRLVSASMDKTVRIWDPETGEQVKMLTPEFTLPQWPLERATFVGDGTRLFTSSAQEYRMYDATTGESLGAAQRMFLGQNAVSSDGNWLAFVKFDQPPAATGEPAPDAARDVTITIAVRDLREVDAVRTLSYVTRAGVRTVALGLNDDGSLLAEARSRGTLVVWDVARSEIQTSWRGQVPPLARIQFSHDNRRLATQTSDGKVKLWDVTSGQEVYTLSNMPEETNGMEEYAAKYGTGNQLGHCVFSPRGDRLAAAGANTVLLWNTAPLVSPGGDGTGRMK